MPSTRTGVIAILAAALAASAGILAFARPQAETAAGDILPLGAPLPTRVPPGTTLVIGDPVTQRILEHNGWLNDLPFQIRWAQITGGPGVTEAFHAKVLDVGTGANIPPIHATWVGIPVKTIAVRFRQDPLDHPSFELAVAPRAGMDTLADLKGKKIAFSPGQVQGEIVLRTLEAQGLTKADVTLVELPSTSADFYVNALVGGMVDVAPIGAGAPVRRYLHQYGSTGGKVLRHPGFRDDLVNLFVRDETLGDPAKAAALRTYVKLWARAAEWGRTHPEELAQFYYVKDQGLSTDDARYVVRAAGEPDIPADWSEAIRLQQGSVALMARETGRKPFDAAVLFDRRFETLAAAEVAAYRARPEIKALALAETAESRP